MEDKIFAAAQHYYDIDKYDTAYQKLSTLELVIDRQDQIEHHILLSLILDGLHRQDEAMSIVDTLVSKFPDNYRCLTHWIAFNCDDHRLVERAFELAQSLRASHPTNYWLPYIMAKMAFSYRLQPPKAIVSLTQEALSLYRNEQTLQLAYHVFVEFDLNESAKACLTELVENFPESESTYEHLLLDLEREEHYSEMSRISYNAIRKFPHNEEFPEFFELAVMRLYGNYLDKLYCTALRWGDNVTIDRSSTKPWFRALQQASTGFRALILLTTFIGGLLIYLLGMLFFLHYTVFASDDRHINKQRKERLLKREFEHNDQMAEAVDGASVLLAATHLKYHLFFLDETGITLAKDAFCALEELHIHFDAANVSEAVKLPRKMIKSIEVSNNYLTLKTRNLGLHMLYFEHLPTLEFITGQLEKYGYYLLQTKSSSRLLLSLSCFFGAKAGLAIAFIVAVSTSWLVGAVFALAVLSNIIGFFLYRLVHPLSTDIYVSRY